MAKKELTPEELFKKEYSNLVKLNQKLKNISEGYYMGHDGLVYMKSLVPFVEKVIVLHDPSLYSRFYGMMIMPNAFFEFTKKAKKTKLISTHTEKCIYLGQNDDESITHTLDVVNPSAEIDKEYIKGIISHKMYKRYFELGSDQYIQCNENELCFTEEEIENLCNANPFYLNLPDTTLTLTKQLMLDIKKDDNISISRTCYQVIEDGKRRVFYTLKQITDLYTCYTIFNTLQS